MPQLARLTSSLTKHGSYKIATLMWLYPIADVFHHISAKSNGIDIDLAQAKKTIGVPSSQLIPRYWQDAKNISKEHLDFATFFSIVLSHGLLISFFKNQNIQYGAGALCIDPSLSSKAFSNLKACARELGFLTNDSKTYFDVDFSSHLVDPASGSLLLSILKSKANLTGYQFTTDVQFITDLVNQHIHTIFGITASDFSNWLLSSGTAIGLMPHPAHSPVINANFRFAPSAQRLNTLPVTRQPRNPTPLTIDRLHAQLQNKLCDELEAAHPGIQFRLEQPTGSGTFMDLVCYSNNQYQIFEIKTASTLWACLREALPQLLEYQYNLWTSGDKASIYLATPHPMNADVQKYIDYLHSSYNITLNYYQIVL